MKPPPLSRPPRAPSASPPASSSAAPLLARPPRPLADSVVGSTSLFYLPSALSAQSLRPRLNLPPSSGAEVDYVSLFVVYFITLVSEAARGLLLPSTWPYLQSLGGTRAALGLLIASFSAGRMATTIPLGYASDHFSAGAVLGAASLVQVIGHLAYALAPSVPTLIFSRVVVGFGSSTMSVCRAHLTRAVTPADRTQHFAYLSALQFVGFAVLPGVGGLLASLPTFNLSGIALNGFTYPAYVLIFANLAAVLLIHMLYFDPPSSSTGSSSPTSNNGATPPLSDDGIAPDGTALLVCLLVNITFRGVVAELETVATPFLMDRFALTYAASSYYISLLGFFGLIIYLNFKPLARAISDRNLVLLGLILLLVGSVPLASPALTRSMSLWPYITLIGILWSIAYPIGQTAVLALFSKVLAGLPAGGFLGLFSASGSLARIMFAMFAGCIWGKLGDDAVFATIAGYVVLAAVLVLFNYRRLVSPV